MKLYSAQEVHTLLDYPFLIDALRRAHEGAHPYGAHLLADDPAGSSNQFVSLLGWQGHSAIAAKLVGVFPGNRDLDPPQASVQGLVAGFDATTGAPRFVADGEAMTFRKTAAVSGLGAALLARPDSEVLLVVGAGGLAPHVLAAHCAARPSIQRVLVWNRTAERAHRLAETTTRDGLRVTATEDLDAAVRAADVISCVTMSTLPLVQGDLLKPGCHLDLVGAYRTDMREADDRAMVRGTLFVDTRNGMEGAGDLAQPVEAALVDWSDIRADFYDLVQGRHRGRKDGDEITVCKNVGGSHLDLFTAVALMSRSEE